MARRRIGREHLGFAPGAGGRAGSPDEPARLIIDWAEIDRLLAGIYAAEEGEQGWPPLALFRAMLLAVWYDPSDVRLAGAPLADRARCRRSCGSAAHEPTPERTPPSSGSGASRSAAASIGRCSRRWPGNPWPRASG